MRKGLLIILAAAIMALAGCVALQKNKIDNGSYAVPAWLQGRWTKVKTGAEEFEGYEIKAKVLQKGHFRANLIDSLGKRKPLAYDCILSDVDGAVYMNLYQPKDKHNDEEGWYIFRLEKVDDKTFRISGLEDQMLDPAASPDEIKDFLKKNRFNDEAFGKRTTYVKQ